MACWTILVQDRTALGIVLGVQRRADRPAPGKGGKGAFSWVAKVLRRGSARGVPDGSRQSAVFSSLQSAVSSQRSSAVEPRGTHDSRPHDFFLPLSAFQQSSVFFRSSPQSAVLITLLTLLPLLPLSFFFPSFPFFPSSSFFSFAFPSFPSPPPSVAAGCPCSSSRRSGRARGPSIPWCRAGPGRCRSCSLSPRPFDIALPSIVTRSFLGSPVSCSIAQALALGLQLWLIQRATRRPGWRR